MTFWLIWTPVAVVSSYAYARNVWRNHYGVKRDWPGDRWIL